MRESRARVAGWAPAAVAAANAAVVAGLWWSAGGLQDLRDAASTLTGAGRLAGLLGAYCALLELLLLARLPILDRLAGFDRLTVWHRRNGRLCLGLLLAHAVLILTGYTLGDGI